MFNFFEELFAPGRKHAAEEQRRLELSRVDLGIGDPARGPIDLTSGRVVVRRPDAGDGEPEHTGPGEPGPGDPESGGAAGERGERL
ncbi:DUF6191 domain-containing protein [Streptomyces brevispora]|uniref:DUF6191 domain-containing protein n=1 Tax=Streptomyces brevispora TaxID=887462 RepID=A0A561V2J5_9ACTN|nr:DUF6191 domain-containing protein [Streptomyces brevispora]TWG05845.1 hypothetical protein FHX80_114327 [Streptomyces brevispora]WSC13160.1 DUF6191 domain-containing protein [Streptomyces brevispora]